MGKRTGGLTVRIVTLVGFVLLLSGAAFAAGEWEWTAGQGWIRGAGVARPTPKEQLHYAYELEQKGEFMDAARQYFLLVQNFPASEEAGVGLQRLARCLFEMENYYTSYKAIEQVIETYPNTGRMSDLVEIELRIAKKLMVSQTPDLLSDREEDLREHNIRRALEILNSVIEHDPYGPVAAEAYLVKGEGHLFINEVQAARAAFETIRDEFPRSDVVERARYGILQCDSLLGNARPQELADQLELLRETERERMQRDRDDMDEMDDVELSIRKLSEVEAAKMLEQAEQYRRMGTRQGVQSSDFLYKEIVRRYPGTPQAEEAMSRSSNIKIPKEQSRVAKVVKGINLNPFSYGKDPEPPWIVPQLGADDMVMVDSGLGPITGVPETGTPSTSYSVGVRPAGLKDEPPPAGFSPASAAPEFIDGTAGQRTVSSDPRYAGAPGGGFGPQYDRRPPPSALPNAPDADLILPPGSVGRTFGGGLSSGFGGTQQGDGYVHPYQDGGVYGGGGNVGRASGYDGQSFGGYAGGQQQLVAPGMPNPNLGRTVDNTPYSDLVGPMADDYNRYGGGYTPAPSYGGGYSNGQSYNPPPQPPARSTGGYSNQGGGWSFGDGLR